MNPSVRKGHVQALPHNPEEMCWLTIIARGFAGTFHAKSGSTCRKT
ncbi:hypothetical protein AVEN_188066-1, partial [Araneus ventricosus]